MVVAMNPKSGVLQSCMCDKHAANFLQGRQDIPTLLGVIEFLDARCADLESELADHCRPKRGRPAKGED